MRNYSDENEGYSYIITVIDTFSKFSWALELKKKDGINVSEAFEKIIKLAISQNHQAPNLLHTDKESSAKSRKRQGETTEHIVLMKILNNKGPKWLPCGTPDDAWKRSDDLPKRLTNCRRSLRRFCNKKFSMETSSNFKFGIKINKYVLFKGSLYIPLPEQFQNKHAIINVKNKDDKCFLWAILFALHHVGKDGQRLKPQMFQNLLKEQKINIYYLKKKGKNTHITVPLEITKIEKTNHIDLLYLTVDDKDTDDENNMNKGHYCWIKNLWKLCGSQMTKDGYKIFLCKICLNSFDTENKLNDHKHYCDNNKTAKIVLPESYNKTLEFEKYNNSLRALFVIYADFEATLQPIYTCKPIEDNDVKKLKLYEDKLKNEIENKNKNMQKVRDHDHLTGIYREAAHSICNLNYQNPRFIPIVFHNLSGYDAHLFIKEFGNDDKQIKLIPNNEEKYISFSKMMPRVVTRNSKYKKDKKIVIFKELRFIDSFKFLPSSLEKLTNNLRNDSKLNLRNLVIFFPKEHLDLVTRKLAYSYEYMDCEEKFNETCLLPIEKLYSSLTDKNITIEEYKNSQKIWKVFNTKHA
ncbi:hypothetical protein QTP88_021334 [Uroleucon formosanum]